MLNITKLTTENLTAGCVTDSKYPVFAFTLESDRQNVTLQEARLTVYGWQTTTT